MTQMNQVMMILRLYFPLMHNMLVFRVSSQYLVYVCIVQDEYLLYIHHNVMSYMVPALYQIMDF